jgi:hypothetical protein
VELPFSPQVPHGILTVRISKKFEKFREIQIQKRESETQSNLGKEIIGIPTWNKLARNPKFHWIFPILVFCKVFDDPPFSSHSQTTRDLSSIHPVTSFHLLPNPINHRAYVCIYI